MNWTENTIKKRLDDVVSEVGKRIIGQPAVVRHAVAACLADGHVLFEDVPGTGKTTLCGALATVLGLEYGRIQGTPDLLPGDVVGTLVFRPTNGEFEFRHGPVFTQLLLVDEINRATPRTQSALLEAMAERQVTVEGETKPLDEAFFVLATANPLESQGVFPLPEAQLDRFLVQLKLGYTSADEEFEMVQTIRLGERVSLKQQLTRLELLELRSVTRNVHVSDDILKYMIQLCRATRKHEQILLGASPRAILQLTALAQALALFDGRLFVIPDDVKEAWQPVMNHRIHMHVEWGGDGSNDEGSSALQDILDATPVPAELLTEV